MNGRKRACVILVADGNMAAAFRGYFGREQWHRSLGCGRFDFDPNMGADLLVDEGGNDPGVYARGHELLRPFLKTHERALVALDCAWDASPGRQAIIDHITRNLVATGWAEDAVKVIAIDPELENWLWQDKDNPHVATVLRYRGQPGLRTRLQQQGHWPAGAAKPPRPKETAEWVLRQARRPRSSAIYEELAGIVSVRGCSDAAFRDLQAAMQSWFPAEDGA
jgi:hypothetical protein